MSETQLGLAVDEGYVKVPASVLFNPTLSASARVVWAAIASYQRGGEEAWPSQEVLRQRLGLAATTVRRALRDLELLGFVEIRRRGNHSNVYSLGDPDRANRAVRTSESGDRERAFRSSEVEAVEVEALNTTTDDRPDRLVVEVWDYWCEKRKPKRTALDPAQAKLIAKALKVRDADELCKAIDGLLASHWHRETNQLYLSRVFATRPGGPTLADQIDSFVERSSSSPAAGTALGRGNVGAGRISELKLKVLEGWHKDKTRPEPTANAREQAASAIEQLNKLGIEVDFEPDGRPVFA